MTNKILMSSMCPTSKFIETERPLINADNKDMLETLLKLSLYNLREYQLTGNISKIVELQQSEIINEIALRN